MELTADQIAAFVADATHSFIERLCNEVQVPRDCALAGVHAEVVAQLTAAFGGETTADICAMAAKRVRDIPARRDAFLAAVRPAGRA